MKMSREDFFGTLKEQVNNAKVEGDLPTVIEVMQSLKDMGMVTERTIKVVEFSQTVEAYDEVLKEVYSMLDKRRHELLDLWLQKYGIKIVKTSIGEKIKQAYLDGYRDGQNESSSQKDLDPWVEEEELRVEGRKGKNAGYDIFGNGYMECVWTYYSGLPIDYYRELKIPWDELGR